MAVVLEPKLTPAPASESSERNFGVLFAGVFVLVGAWPLITGSDPRWWSFGVALAFALAAVIRPSILRPLNRAWLALGRLMHRVVSPLVMSAIFFLCVTPTAWIMRLRGKDILSLARRPDLATYWITREPPLPASETMKNQF